VARDFKDNLNSPGDIAMKSMHLRLLALLVPTLVTLMVVVGCGDKKGNGKGSGDGGSGDGGSTGGAKTALEGKGRGTLKGKVVYDGTPPNMDSATADLRAKMKAKDEAHCLDMKATPEEITAFQWRVDPNTKGVENVFVWLAPPAGSYFKLSDADIKSAKPEVEIDQPHCAFIPHCAVAFTHYDDGKGLKPTGQKVIFRNNAPMAHNTNYKGLKVPGKNLLLNPGDTLTPTDIRPDAITLSCEIHAWMRAYIRDFDHPFATVTDKEGNYEIKNVPTGVPVQLVIWHEQAEFEPNGSKGKTVTLKDGDEEDFKIKAK
jgi:hypothetical protein